MQRLHTTLAATMIFSAATLATLPTVATFADAFTYQGELRLNGNAVNDNCDFRFTLWNATSGGSQIGGIIQVSNQALTDGRITATLDFGNNAFDGADRYIQVQVRCPAGSGSYTTLTPRQPVMPAPYALKSLGNTMSWADSANRTTTNDRVGIGGSANQQLHVQGSGGSPAMVAIDANDAPSGRQAIGLGVNSSNGDFQISRLTNAGSSITRNDFVIEAATGDVGIGTTNPIARLNVTDPSGVVARFSSSGGSTAIIGEVSGGNGDGRAMSLYGISSNDLLRVHNDGTGPAAFFDGFVGVGRTDQVTSAELFGLYSGTTGFAGMYIETADDGEPFYGYSAGGDIDAYTYYSGGTEQWNLYVGSTRMTVDANSGHVGIGIGAPATRLHINGGNDSSLGGGGYITTGSISGTNISIDNNEIMARNNGNANDLLINREGGDVFIGSASGGTSTLITPVIQITGGSDLSEMFDVNGDVEPQPGMVVVIDPENPGQLMPSSTAYDIKVAGIISGAGGVATGMTMGQDGSIADGEHPVALTGRVYCLVDATDGAIEPGDMLTTSNTPGHAMKASDRDRAHGSVIGKAMTSLEAGETGLVLVLVNLQ